MIKESLNALGASTRDALRNWRGLLLLSALYLALLASVYDFFSTGVATGWQLIHGTALAALAAPLLFFLLQAAAANFALPGATFGAVARRTPRDFLKVLLLALPLIGLAVLFVYLLGKFEGWLPKIEEAPHAYVTATGDLKPAPLYWQSALVSSLWLLLLGFLLPLAAAHLWLSAARTGLAATLKSIHRVLGRAFSGPSVLVYAAGFFVFGLMPYFVLFTRTPVSNGWAELFLFGLRIVLAFVLTLWGWAITLGALARVTPGGEAPVVVEPAPAPPPPPQESATAEPQLQA
jgi:hypothetical protein